MHDAGSRRYSSDRSSCAFRGGERSEHFRVSLMEFQKFLLEYQRVSSAPAVGPGDGQGAVGLRFSQGWSFTHALCSWLMAQKADGHP